MENIEIQGKYADSPQEVWSAIYLYEEGIDFYFQVAIDGGDWTPGGQVLDFLIILGPIRQPVNVSAKYWHSNDDWEQWKIDRQRQIYGIEPIVLDAREMTDQETTKAVWKKGLSWV